MTKVLLCSEGATEHGYEEYRDGEYIYTDGVMQVLIRKLATDSELDFSVKKRNDIKEFRLIPTPRRYTSKSQAVAAKIAAMANKEECRHIAYHRDEDDEGFEKMYRQVQSYFTVAEASDMRCLAIVPMHMTESWLLSDENAFPKKPNNPALPKRPEETWGKPTHDNHPKKYMKRVLSQFGKEPTTDEYRNIAEKSSVDVMRARCPVSFGRFCDDMVKFITTETD